MEVHLKPKHEARKYVMIEHLLEVRNQSAGSECLVGMMPTWVTQGSRKSSGNGNTLAVEPIEKQTP